MMKKQLIGFLIAASSLGIPNVSAQFGNPFPHSGETPTQPVEPVKRKPKVLLCAFEPFQDSLNISQAVLEAIDTSRFSESMELKTVILPAGLAYKQKKKFDEAVSEFEPDIIFGMGEQNYAEDPGIEIETQANSTKKDSITIPNPGLDTLGLKAALQRSGIKVASDNDCGDGPCNRLYEASLEYARRKGGDSRAYFVHMHDKVMTEDNVYKGNGPPFPYTEEQKQKYRPLIEDYVQAIEAALRYVVNPSTKPLTIKLQPLEVQSNKRYR